MNKKQLKEHVANTHVRIAQLLIRDLEAKQKTRPLTESEKAALARAKRLQQRR